MLTRMPVLFIGHGSPENALSDNAFTKSLSKIAAALKQKPKAILVISAHWLTKGTFVSTTDKPETIHDFYGFPDELYEIEYPAPGARSQAMELMKLLPEAKQDEERGMDHGAWAILRHIFPDADIPVFQLSIDFYKPMQYHYDLAKKLIVLRDKGVLIIGSGNIVHNLGVYFERKDDAYDWAEEFDGWVKDKINKKDFQSLIDYKKAGRIAQLSVPTPDHYIPLIYSMALVGKDEKIRSIYEEVSSSISMRSIRIG